MDTSSSKRAMNVGATVLIVLAILAIACVVQSLQFRPSSKLYQVVLLSNDQAFYGKLHAVGSRYPYLTDVYYLNKQAPTIDKNGRQVGGDKFTVIKRGIDEIHAPTDRLYIPKNNIVYWENIGENSLVAQGIQKDKDYRAGQKQAAPTPPAAKVTPPPPAAAMKK